uniref:Uncharacterized protein n=1 Tax=Macrostomum lignano TaxID=282301 RepID=A0A1I8IVV7_9PLAT
MHRLMGACVSRSCQKTNCRSSSSASQSRKHAAKSPKRAHSFALCRIQIALRRQAAPPGRVLRFHAGCLQVRSPLPDRRQFCLMTDRHPVRGLARICLPCRSVTIDNFNLAAKSDDSPSLQPEPSATSAAASAASIVAQPFAGQIIGTHDGGPAAASAFRISQCPSCPQCGRSRTGLTLSLPIAKSARQLTTIVRLAVCLLTATSVYRRSRLASGASSLDSDDLMLGTDCDTDCEHDTGGGGGVGGDDDTCGGASLTTSRAGTDLADCLIREE